MGQEALFGGLQEFGPGLFLALSLVSRGMR
ncbi:hypothetical protein BN970_04967 [Mycolicibacterium conceptionense]|uniref:Uncharacterized protein n=1 Tax=Mycolicibacterium conceptionense TaxID=451644 RepID=A0A0U1DTA8_9MYCO|nr:hypothetical protein BN970_04967 [Mycolicibacterium conceptionense]